MADDTQPTEIKVTNPLLCLVKEKVVEAPDRTFFTVIRIFLGRVTVYTAILETHFVVDHSPHPGVP